MAFRSDEAAKDGFERACRYLSPQGASATARQKVRAELESIVSKHGPVVEGYPAWHPFMVESDSSQFSTGVPEKKGSFAGLDHTIYFQNAILTCPYGHAEVGLIKQIKALSHRDVDFDICKLEGVTLYNENATPLLITCSWNMECMEFDNTFSMKTVLGLLLEREIPNWRNSQYSESWEAMREQVLGYPHGARSSLFVNQTTGQQVKNVWNQIIKSGLFGEPKDW